MNAPITITETGLRFDLSNEAYHAGPGISKSSLDAVAKSPAHYFARYLDENRPEREPTAAMIAGTLAHCAVLEPEEFANRYAVGPDISKATKEWKAFEASLADGRQAIKPDQLKQAFAQSTSVRSIPDIADLLSKGFAEVSAYWHDEETGILCKCRPDWVHPCDDGSVIIVDLKTTTDASPREFSRSIAEWRYHVQAAWYADGYAKASGLTVRGFVFAAVETDFPHLPAAYMLDEESIEQGRIDYRRNLETYAECLACGIWPGYEKEIQLTRIPNWAFDQDEELSIGYV